MGSLRIGTVVALLALPACDDLDPVGPAGPGAPRLGAAAAAFVSSFEYPNQMVPRGYSARLVPLENLASGAGIINTDLAFWGRYAFQGTYEGFRIIDISDPPNPREVTNFTGCVQGTTAGNQGDLVVWEHILVRSWNSPSSGATSCGGIATPEGFEGIHIFDVSDPTNPVGLGLVELECGSHTTALVPDLSENRLLVYSVSGVSCSQIDIIGIPLDAPQDAALLRVEPAERECGELAVILGEVKRLACAGGNGFAVWSLASSGGFVDPELLDDVTISGVTNARGVAWTWDGEILVVGHEPGGGVQARCQASSSTIDRSLFLYDGNSRNQIGTFVLPRAQSERENCSWGLFNVVPTSRGYVLVSGNYQSGISVVNFSDPANAREVGFADPAPLVNPDNPGGIEQGGDWAAYWYNGNIYQSDMTRGLIVWKLASSEVAGARNLDHLNPQTLEFSIP